MQAKISNEFDNLSTVNDLKHFLEFKGKRHISYFHFEITVQLQYFDIL